MESRQEGIENEILMAIRKDKKYANQVSLNEPIGFDSDGNEVSLMDVLQSDTEDICEKIDKENMIALLYRKIKTIMVKIRLNFFIQSESMHTGNSRPFDLCIVIILTTSAL